MSKKIICVTGVILGVISILILFFALHRPIKKETIKDDDPLFMDKVPECSSILSTSDRFGCLYRLATNIEKENDSLAHKLITQAPIRLKELNSTTTGPVSFVYGGRDFLVDLPIQVEKAKNTKIEYIKNICNLASMRIYGGSGMDLEQNACKYHFEKEYLYILKNLEQGLIVP